MAFKLTIKNNISIPWALRKVEDSAFWEFGANEWWRLITPYTPMETGALSETVTIKGEKLSGRIQYKSPQAHYLYHGKLMIDAETGSPWARKRSKKVYTNRELVMSRLKHPMASKEWDLAAEPTQKPELISAMQKYIESGRLKLNE